MAETSRSRRWVGSMRRLLSGRRTGASSLPVAPAEEPSRDAVPDPRLDVLLAEWREVQRAVRSAGAQRLARLAVFVVASAAIAGPYLEIVGGANARLALARWVLPALGLLVGLEFLALEAAAQRTARIFERRGLKVEAALNALLPRLGRIQILALATEGAVEGGGEGGAWALIAFYGLLTLGWLVALVATAVGGLPGVLAR